MMNSVHFPKLEEYAIEPVLIKEPSSYGNFGSSSHGRQSSSRGESRYNKIDQLGKGTASAYFQRPARAKSPYETGPEAASQKKPLEIDDHVDTDLSKNHNRNRRLLRQKAFEGENSCTVDDNVPSLPPLTPGRTLLVSNNLNENSHAHDGSHRRLSREADGSKAEKNSPKTFHRIPAANAFEVHNSSDQSQLEKSVSVSPDEEGEEIYASTAHALRKAYKFRKGSNRVQSQFIDGSLWDHEVSGASREKNKRDSLNMPTLSLRGSLTTRNYSSAQDVTKTKEVDLLVNKAGDHGHDSEVEHRFKSRLQNGINYPGHRRNLWRIHLRKLFPKKDQLQRFQKLTVGIVNVLKLAKAIIKPTDSPSALLKNFTAMSKEPEKEEDASDHMKSYGLEFDASYFRANREISISSEVKNILRKPSNRRTPEDIQTAIFGLQSLPSFAEYPLHMQEKLAKVAWYEIVTPMRTIIRQGHFAENFYFILSGQALVTIHKPGDATPKTAGMMRRGTSFGELALLHHSRRTATVTSHDTVQLLSVGREDFFDIFMSGHGSDQMPEHIKFIRRNMVILKASEVSEWFYVVKSGSCQVLKQLKGVTGRLGQLASSRHSVQDKEGKLRSGASFQDSRINTGRRSVRKKDSAINIIDHVRAHNHVANGSSKTTDRLQPYSEEEEGYDSHLGANRRGISSKSSRNGVQEIGKNARPLPHGQSFSKLSIGPPHFRSVKSMDSESKENRKDRTKSFSYHRRQRREQHQQQKQHQTQQQQQQHEAPPVFVQIELLKPRDVFGLDMVNFNSVDFQRSTVSLVSLGAECIMLSKAFFLKHANDRVKKRFSEIVQPYPDERSLQASLQNKADWELYKHSLLTTITAPKPTGLRGTPLMSHY
ncbi:cAMP-dependent protein kinase regulatory subunit [Elysia marginata]|uniref:cAMP-dependent protein kinase regulatory subunit n=1 Tax=Elysia marginata TaxID=1093978 RepID=A0AAV4HNF5_9GAST|nr:cAMP-dependent protein kinase regulatory subunit [Elysia marginata]